MKQWEAKRRIKLEARGKEIINNNDNKINEKLEIKPRKKLTALCLALCLMNGWTVPQYGTMKCQRARGWRGRGKKRRNKSN